MEIDTTRVYLDLEPVRFNFFTMQFTPLRDVPLSSNEIIHKIVDSIRDQRSNGNIIIFDRYKNRPNVPARQLYVSYSTYVPAEKRLKMSMALIRSGKQPLLKKNGSIEEIPFDKEIGEFVEITHFYLDLNRPVAVVCVEYNDNGPRMTDIEYYFRAMSTDYIKLSRALSVNMMIDSNIAETIESLTGVFDFDIKIEGKKFSEMDNSTKGFLSEWGTLLTKLQPEFIRIEAFFQRKGRKNNSASTNEGVLKGLRGLLKQLMKPNNSDAFDKLVINYEDVNGNAQKFDLFDKKSEIIAMLDLSKTVKNTDVYKAIKNDFDQFLISRYHA